MNSGLMAPAISRIAAIELRGFILSIVGAENAIRNVIVVLKNELFDDYRGGLRPV